MANPGQGEEFLRVPAAGGDPDQPDSRGVVLELVPADRVVGARLIDHQDVTEAPRAHAGRLPGERDPGDVVEVDRRYQALAVCGTGHGPGHHVDAAVGMAGAPDPGARRPGELAAGVLLGVLAEVPYVPLVVLGEEREFLLLQPALEEVTVPGDHRIHAVDHLGEAADGEHHRMRRVMAALENSPGVAELGPRHQREHRVVHPGRRGEPVPPALGRGRAGLRRRAGRAGLRRCGLLAGARGAARGQWQRAEHGERCERPDTRYQGHHWLPSGWTRSARRPRPSRSRRLRPNRRYREGSTSRLSRVEVARPPSTTTASGCSISCPGRSPSSTSGTRARPVASDVIRIGDSRSRAPRITSAVPNSMPSSCSRCCQWLISRMPLRAAMPNTVKKPTNDPREMIPPPAHAARIPPTSAIGSVTKASTASRHLRNDAWSSSRIRTPAMSEDCSSRDCAACRSWYSPSISMWYPRFRCTAASLRLMSLTTAPRSRPATAAPTSRYRESPCWSMALGLGCKATVATEPSRTRPPDGVSMGRSATSLKLCRTEPGLHTTTS